MTDVVLKNIDRKDGDFTIPESTYINVYLAGFLNDELIGHLHLQAHNDYAYVQIHWTMLTWNPTIARATKKAFYEQVIPIVQSLGGRVIVTINHNEVEKWAKLMKYIGFDIYDLEDGSKMIMMEV